MTIKRNNPVREEFSACSSGNGPDSYYETKGHAISAFDAVLADYGYMLDRADNSAWSGNEGRCEVTIYYDYECGPIDAGRAIFYYYRMPSGRWEFIGYIA